MKTNSLLKAIIRRKVPYLKSFTTTDKTSNEKNKSKNEKYVIKLKEIMIIDKTTPGGSS